MTVASTTVKAIYTGNGSQTSFAVPFSQTYFQYAASDIVVVLRDQSVTPAVDTVQSSPSQYSIVSNNVVMVTAPTASQKLLVKRYMPMLQQVSYPTTGPFPASSHEGGLDRLWLKIQELEEQISRAALLPQSSSASLVMPEPVPSAPLMFDASGNLTAPTGVSGYTIIKAGQVTLSPGDTSASVTYGTPFSAPGNPIPVLMNTTDGTVDFQPITVTQNLNTGFGCKWNDPIPNGNYKLVYMAAGTL